MAFSNIWSNTGTSDSTAANSIDNELNKARLDIAERLMAILGIADFTLDPITLTAIQSNGSIIITINTKLPYTPEYDAGNSGTTKTLDFIANGPCQRLTMTGNCTLTITQPPNGASGDLLVVEGGFALTWPSNAEAEGDTTPTPTTTAGKGTLYWWRSTASKVIYGIAGTNVTLS